MIRLKALNDSSDSLDSSDEDCQVTREVEEEKLNKLYMSALKFASEGNTEEAINTFDILKHELESNVLKVKDAILLSKLKYLTYKNLGLLKSDLDLVLDALDIDGSDINLWIIAGKKGKETLNCLVSKYCFEKAFSLNNANLIVIENLIDIYFILNDLSRCLQVCLLALEIDPDYIKAKIMLNHCIFLMPPLLKEMDDYKCFLSPKFGGDDYTLIEKEIENYSQQIVEQLSNIKTKRFLEDDLDNGNKRKLLNFNISQKHSTFSEIGFKIKKLYDDIQKCHLSISTPIKIIIDDTGSKESSIIDENAEIDWEKSVEDKSISMESKTKEKKNKEEKISFNLYEFSDKRRSSRVKGKSNKSSDYFDDQSITETLFELLPDSLKLDESAKSDSNDKESSSDSSNEVQSKLGSKSVESEHLSNFFTKIQNYCLSRFVNILDIIEFYLTELSILKGIEIPDIFIVLYKIYRSNNPLPFGYTCEIGQDISVDSIMNCLTFNEIEFDKTEVLFLREVLLKLAPHLSTDSYRQFLIRFFVLCGSKEFNDDYLNFALDLCQPVPIYARHFNLHLTVSEMDVDCQEDKNNEQESTDLYQVLSSNNQVIDATYINTIINMHSISIEKMSSDCDYFECIKLFFKKSEKDLTEDEKCRLNKAIVETQMWQKGIDLFDNWSELDDDCLETILECVLSGERGRLTSKLTAKIIKHAICGKSIIPWLILYWAFIAEGVSISDHGTPLIKFFKLGHNLLGKKGICTERNGEFLILAQKVFVFHEIEEEALKCFTCLFDYPLRKCQSVSECHTSSHIDLKWEHCEDIFAYIAPEHMPEFDSHARQSGISQDVKDLFIKILRLIPEDKQPIKLCRPINDYISNGNSLHLITPHENSSLTSTIYYLLADFHFKAKDFKKAKQFYIFDLALNVNRFDAWAGLALSLNYQLDQMLINGNDIYNEKFFKTAFSVIQCFEHALRLQPTNNKLWIEFGIMCYNVASNISRRRKLSNNFGLNYPEQYNSTYPKYEQVLLKAKQSFQKVLINDNDELWLSYYMLGKVSEKNKENISDTLQYYELADLSLYLDGAKYPKKLPFYSPPTLSVEALEIHYRIHACILKYLINNRKFSARSLRQVKYHLLRASKSPFVLRRPFLCTTHQKEKKVNSSKDKSINEQPTGNDLEFEVKDFLNDVVSIVSERDFKFDVNRTRNELIDMCITGIKRCLSRYSAHYKSYYRLAFYFNHIMDYSYARSLLINSKNNSLFLDSDGSKTSSVVGLFVIKGLNLYTGIWRIPVDEIERAGTFNSHMFKCTNLLIRVCSNTNDYHSLSTIAIQLYRIPDADKKFLNEDERVVLSKYAFDACFNTMATQLTKIDVNKQKIVEDIQNIAQNFIKNQIFNEETIKKCQIINEQLVKMRR